MPDATLLRGLTRFRKTADAAVASGEVHQLPDGRAGVRTDLSAAASGDATDWETEGQYQFTKAAGFVALKGGRAYWDHSANAVSYKKVGDRDFYLGRFTDDATSAATTCNVWINVDPPDTIDLARNGFTTAIVKTAGVPLLNARGGTLNVVLDATNEAQKVDALSVDSFANAANAVVEFAFRVPSDGAGTAVDVSVGIASATHATDASAIAQRLFMHLDANATDVRFESSDGTTTVAITDSLADYTEGALLANRVEVWFDLRTPADVQVYVNGSLVLDGTTFNVNVAASEWKLLLHVEKTASTDTYEFDLDWLRVRLAEQ